MISPALRSGGEDAKEEEDPERSEADGRRGGSKDNAATMRAAASRSALGLRAGRFPGSFAFC